MKIKEGFIVKEIAAQSVVIALGEASKIFNGLIKLNDTGRFIWDKLSEGMEASDIAEAMLSEYEGVDKETAEKDVEKFIDVLRGANILE